MRTKEERSKRGQTNNKAKQHSTPKYTVEYILKLGTMQIHMYMLFAVKSHGSNDFITYVTALGVLCCFALLLV